MDGPLWQRLDEPAQIEGQTRPASLGGYLLLLLSTVTYARAIATWLNLRGRDRMDLGAGLGGLVALGYACLAAVVMAAVAGMAVKICGRGNRRLAFIALAISSSFLAIAVLGLLGR